MRADLALVGFGNVGRRFVRILDEQPARLRDEYDIECRIVGIATRRHGCAYDPHGLDGQAAADRVETGAALPASPPSPATAAAGCLDIIARLSTSDAPIRVVVETTT